QALSVIADRETSFWLDRDVTRKAQWEACRRMAELGAAAAAVHSAVARMSNGPGSWVQAYTSKGGWHRLDQAQRRLEAWVADLEEREDRPLAVVRHAYEDTCEAMAAGFSRALANAKWTIPSVLHQTHIYKDVLMDRPKPVAYFLVDAMRFEMAVE